MPVSLMIVCAPAARAHFDVDVVVGIVEERPEAKPRGDEYGFGENGIEDDINLVLADPRSVAKDTGPLEHLFIFECYGGRHGKLDHPFDHPAEDRV